MRYNVFTDGAYNQDTKRMAAAFLVLTANTYIAKGFRCAEGRYVERAEDLAVHLALDWMFREVDLKPDDYVMLYVDSQAVINYFTDVRNLDSQPPSYDLELKQTWELLQKLTVTCKWRFVKCEAHRKEINGNVVVDRLAKYALRLKQKRKPKSDTVVLG